MQRPLPLTEEFPIDLALGKYLKVANRDPAHATDTARHIRRKAKINRRECSLQLVGSDLYCRLLAPKQEADICEPCLALGEEVNAIGRLAERDSAASICVRGERSPPAVPQ